jgi:hypothetical protein
LKIFYFTRIFFMNANYIALQKRMIAAMAAGTPEAFEHFRTTSSSGSARIETNDQYLAKRQQTILGVFKQLAALTGANGLPSEELGHHSFMLVKLFAAAADEIMSREVGNRAAVKDQLGERIQRVATLVHGILKANKELSTASGVLIGAMRAENAVTLEVDPANGLHTARKAKLRTGINEILEPSRAATQIDQDLVDVQVLTQSAATAVLSDIKENLAGLDQKISGLQDLINAVTDTSAEITKAKSLIGDGNSAALPSDSIVGYAASLKQKIASLDKTDAAVDKIVEDSFKKDRADEVPPLQNSLGQSDGVHFHPIAYHVVYTTDANQKVSNIVKINSTEFANYYITKLKDEAAVATWAKSDGNSLATSNALDALVGDAMTVDEINAAITEVKLAMSARHGGFDLGNFTSLEVSAKLISDWNANQNALSTDERISYGTSGLQTTGDAPTNLSGRAWMNALAKKSKTVAANNAESDYFPLLAKYILLKELQELRLLQTSFGANGAILTKHHQLRTASLYAEAGKALYLLKKLNTLNTAAAAPTTQIYAPIHTVIATADAGFKKSSTAFENAVKDFAFDGDAGALQATSKAALVAKKTAFLTDIQSVLHDLYEKQQTLTQLVAMLPTEDKDRLNARTTNSETEFATESLASTNAITALAMPFIDSDDRIFNTGSAALAANYASVATAILALGGAHYSNDLSSANILLQREYDRLAFYNKNDLILGRPGSSDTEKKVSALSAAIQKALYGATKEQQMRLREVHQQLNKVRDGTAAERTTALRAAFEALMQVNDDGKVTLLSDLLLTDTMITPADVRIIGQMFAQAEAANGKARAAEQPNGGIFTTNEADALFTDLTARGWVMPGVAAGTTQNRSLGDLFGTDALGNADLKVGNDQWLAV